MFVTNPAPLLLTNGSILMIYKASTQAIIGLRHLGSLKLSNQRCLLM